MGRVILHVITSIRPGGAENHLLALACAQARGGASVAVAYLKDDPELADGFSACGVETIRLGLSRYGDPLPALRLARLIARRSPDIVHAHMPPAELYARLALLLRLDRHTPLVISRHNTERFFDGPCQATVARWVARRADRVIAISQAVRDDTCARQLAPPDAIDVIPYGIDPSPFRTRDPATRARMRLDWGLAPEEFAVGAIARLTPQKGLDVLLAAVAIAARGSGRRLRLAIAGEGPLRHELAAQARNLGIEGAILWLGKRPPVEVPALFAAFDLFILPSRYEGLGLVLLEALAAEVPIVASRVGPIPEILRDGITGTLVPPGDADALAKAIAAAATGQAVHDVAIARADLETHFSVDTMLASTKRSYDAAVAARA
jgi:glycosyltransferase involved in cell wall biosynthesis